MRPTSGVGYAADHSFDNGFYFPGSWDYLAGGSLNFARYCGNAQAFEGSCYSEFNSPVWSAVHQDLSNRGPAAPSSMYMCARIRSPWNWQIETMLILWDLDTATPTPTVGFHTIPAGDSSWRAACTPVANGLAGHSVRVQVFNMTPNHNLSVDDVQVWSA